VEFSPHKEGIMDNKRLLELALETLLAKRTEIERSIAEIREMQDGKRRIFTRNPEISALLVVKKRSRTQAQRKALSRRMKQIWAAKKRQTAKPSPSKAKRKPMSAARKRALSLKMKQIWAKKKSAVAKKAQK
jgi:hypothetical protein